MKKAFFIALLSFSGIAQAQFYAPIVLDWMEQGKTYLSEGEYNKAREVYAQAFRNNPFDAVAANNLAVACAANREFSCAEKYLKTAASLAPDRHDIQENLQRLRSLNNYRGVKYPDEAQRVLSNQPRAAKVISSGSEVPPIPPAMW